MSQGQEAILFSNPEIVAGVILVMMGIDNDLGMKCLQELHKPISAKGKARIDQKPINKKGMYLVKGKA